MFTCLPDAWFWTLFLLSFSYSVFHLYMFCFDIIRGSVAIIIVVNTIKIHSLHDENCIFVHLHHCALIKLHNSQFTWMMSNHRHHWTVMSEFGMYLCVRFPSVIQSKAEPSKGSLLRINALKLNWDATHSCFVLFCFWFKNVISNCLQLAVGSHLEYAIYSFVLYGKIVQRSAVRYLYSEFCRMNAIRSCLLLFTAKKSFFLLFFF